MNSMEYSVSGITNKESKTQIKNALDKIKGIQEVAVNAAEGTIKIDYNEPATEPEIRDCIENTGVKITYH